MSVPEHEQQEPSHDKMRAKRIRQGLSGYFIVITYAAIILIACLNYEKIFSGLKWVLGILSPFLIGVFIAFIVNMPMRFFENKVLGFMKRSKRSLARKMVRPLAMILAFAAILAVLAAVVAVIAPQLGISAKRLADSFPAYLANITEWLTDITKDLEISPDLAAKLEEAWNEFSKNLTKLLKDAVPGVINFATSFTSGLVSFFMSVIISVYMLAAKEKLLRHVKSIVCAFVPERYAKRLLAIGSFANETYRNFFFGQFTEAFILGGLCFIGMTILRMPYALLISVVVGFTGLIPIFGAFIGTVPGAFILLMINPWQAFWFIIFIIVIQQIEGNIIYPRVVGHSIGLSGLWVLFAILVGGGLFDFTGILLGVPTFAVLYRLLGDWVKHRNQDRDTSFIQDPPAGEPAPCCEGDSGILAETRALGSEKQSQRGRPIWEYGRKKKKNKTEDKGDSKKS